MFGDGALAFREFVMKESLPLAAIQDAVFEFLRGRTDAVMFGAQAVNAHARRWRMTEDVDILSIRAKELAEELKQYLHDKFHVAIRVRSVRQGIGYRIYQVQKPENRHLADVRPVQSFPPTQSIDGVLVPIPEEVIASKVMAFTHRKDRPKGGTDWRDLAEMLLAFPALKEERGAVLERLILANADAAVLETWRTIVNQLIRPETDEEEFES